VAGEEGRKTLLAEAACVLGARVTLDEGRRDLRVEVGEDAGGSGPEGFELGAQPVGERDARLNEVLAGAGI
jgi:hypothetical protein